MITNSNIQAAWISHLKANVPIVALVSATEIKEDTWQGTDFTYPNIRVKLNPLTPQTQNPDCKVYLSDVSIIVSSEAKSSKQADDIAGVVFNEMIGHSFSGSTVKIGQVALISLVPATVPEGRDIWEAIVNLKTVVSNV